jgi:arylsulfatase A-like enzyme
VGALAALLTGFGSGGSAAASESVRPERPNVIVILADDLGYADVGYHGSGIDTPGIDRIAAEGVRLERFYATPICSPTRAALLTGRDPMKLGIAYHALMPWHSHGLALEEHLMPQSFQAAGYQTAMVGKWHLGHTIPQHHPGARGFDHFYGHLHTAVDFWDHEVTGAKDLQANRKTVDGKGRYATWLEGEEAVRWVKQRDASKPFFLYLPFLAPHNPMQAPADLIEKYASIPETPVARGARPGERRINAAMVDAMDQMIVKLLDTLDEEGIADQTLVLFLSDNGGSIANGSSNAPLRGWKMQAYEGGIRVVATLRLPGALPAGTISEQVMTVADVFPTLAAAAGVPVAASKALDGENLWPELSGGRVTSRKQDLFFTVETAIAGRFQHAVLAAEGGWKLVQTEDRVQNEVSVKNELFKVAEDTPEQRDLAAGNPEVVAELEARLRRWRAMHPVGGTGTQLVPHPGWRPPRDWAEGMAALEGVVNDEITFDEMGAGLPQLPGVKQRLDEAYGDRGRLLYE